MAAKLVSGSRVESFTNIAEAAQKMSIVELTSQPAVREMTEDIAEKNKVKFIDMKYQMVLWKKTTFLLDNIAFTKELCENLVNEGIFDVDMMNEIMRPTYDIERCLRMLTLLGTHGDNVYEGFLRALKNSKQVDVVNEIRRTEKFIKYGEPLPPAYHYFLNLSQFLRKYPHIAVKLGEEEKHILQSFIDGHIEVGIRKNKEKVIKMENKILKLKDQIRQLKEECKRRAAHEAELQRLLDIANAKIDEYRNRALDAENVSMEHRNEARKLRHFRTQQEELVKFIGEKGVALKMPNSGPRELTRQLSNMRSMLERQKTQITNFIVERQKTETTNNNRQNSKLGSRQPTSADKFISNNPETYLTNLRINQTDLNLLANKVYYSLLSVQSLEKEENRLKILLDQEGHDKAYRQDMRKLLVDIKRDKKLVKDQMVVHEKELHHKESEVMAMRKELLGVGTTPADVQFYKTQHDSLISQIENVFAHVKFLHGEDMKEEERRREKIIADYLEHIQELKNKHIEEIGKLKLKIRLKISEIYDREKLIARLRKQIVHMCNYTSKNMNASIPVDECRKIVRDIIGEVRKLKAIAEEKDREKAELERLEGDDDAIAKFHEKKAAVEAKKQKIKDKRKWKKKQSYLADDRLRYVGDRLCLEWRVLGKCLGLTNNRMDMVEWDCPPTAKQDLICFAMMKAWRDEESGKIVELVEALRQMGRDDLALIVLPIDRMHLLDKKKKKGEGSDDEEEEDEEKDEDDMDLDEVGAETDAEGEATLSEKGSNVPKLPAVKGATGKGGGGKKKKGNAKKKK